MEETFNPVRRLEEEKEKIVEEAKEFWSKKLNFFIFKVVDFPNLNIFENALLLNCFTEKIQGDINFKDTQNLYGKRYQDKKIGLRKFFIDLNVPITIDNKKVIKPVRINLILELFNPFHHALSEDMQDKEWDERFDVSKIVYFDNLEKIK